MNMKKVRGADEELTFVTEPEMNYYLNAYTLTVISLGSHLDTSWVTVATLLLLQCRCG